MTEISEIVKRLLDLQDHYPTSGQLGPENRRIFAEAADIITRLSERTDDAVRAEKFAAQLIQLQKGIQDYLDGDYGRNQHFNSKHDKCPHGQFGWEACERCIDDHFSRLLAVVSKSGEGS